MKRRIIGVTGRKDSGKDVVAAVLKREHNYDIVRFADGLKAMMHALIIHATGDADLAVRMIEGDLKDVPDHRILGGKTPRYVMQTLGTEWGRDTISKDIWVDVAESKIKGTDNNVVIPDVRFANEDRLIHALGGRVVKVDRDARPNMNDEDHTSESYEGVQPDTTLDNNYDIKHIQLRAYELHTRVTLWKDDK